jgi:hypothetical protein
MTLDGEYRYSECHLCHVTFKPIMLSFVIFRVIILSAITLLKGLSRNLYLQRVARDKHSSLFTRSKSTKKKFYNINTRILRFKTAASFQGAIVIEHFTAVIYE